FAGALLAQDFFPLEVGNLWSFEVYSGGQPQRHNMEITGDTTFTNDHHYFLLSNPDVTLGPYVRVDSGFIYLAEQYDGAEVPVYNLNARLGETRATNWRNLFFSVTLYHVDTTTVFGRQTVVYYYGLDGLTVSEIRFSRDFGPLEIHHYGDPPNPFPVESYYLTGCIIGDSTYGTVVGIGKSEELPAQFQLLQNYPNPFNPVTNVEFGLPNTEWVTLKVYDLLGREVKTLVDQRLPAGYHTVQWDGTNHAGQSVVSGVYLYRLEAGNFVQTRKMVLLR
ncbi:MAG: T9SS C-terminal target domain-containing protein, partial [Calditrichaeota bacterium]